MKNLTAFLSILLFLSFQSIQAKEAIFIDTEDHPQGTCTMEEYIVDQPISQKAIHSLQKEEKQKLHLEAKFKKYFSTHHSKHRPVNGFSDPVDKFFWIWTIGWGAGILITVFAGASIASGFLGILWLSLFIIGSVALVIWLVKKFGNP